MTFALTAEQLEGIPYGTGKRLRELESRLGEFLASPIIHFDDSCRRRLPDDHGVYRIFELGKSDSTIRAGRTKTAIGGLRQRVYQNHLMGNQAGNLRTQLVSDRTAADLASAKKMIRERYAVQVLVIRDRQERVWFEHFMLAALRPLYCD